MDDDLGTLYTGDGVARLLGITEDDVDRLVSDRLLLAVPTNSGRLLYPTFQFDGASVVGGLNVVLPVLLSAFGPTTAGRWLSTPSALFNGRRAIDALRDGDAAAVVAAAKQDTGGFADKRYLRAHPETLNDQTTKKAFANTISYEVPSSLHALVGPANGIVELPRSLYWGPERAVDLSNHSDVQRMYQAVIRTGSASEQEQWLNRDLLIDIWLDLVLPIRCVNLWESTFDELASGNVANVFAVAKSGTAGFADTRYLRAHLETLNDPSRDFDANSDGRREATAEDEEGRHGNDRSDALPSTAASVHAICEAFHQGAITEADLIGALIALPAVDPAPQPDQDWYDAIIVEHGPVYELRHEAYRGVISAEVYARAAAAMLDAGHAA